MRPIKFRIWSKLRNIFIFPEWIDFNVVEQDGTELLQFTGMKDKNGVEICEGDIVRGICSKNTAYVCEGLQQSDSMGKTLIGVVRYSSLYAQFYVTTDDITYLDLAHGINEIEIIGNEYEHADTLFLHSIPGMVESILKAKDEK